VGQILRVCPSIVNRNFCSHSDMIRNVSSGRCSRRNSLITRHRIVFFSS